MRVPWDLSKTPAPGEGFENLPDETGIALGVELARLADIEESKELASFPDSPPRCDDCAFRAGMRPNGCSETLMDAIKCVAELIPFYCHKGVKGVKPAKRLCAGWGLLALAPYRIAKESP